MSDSTHMDKEPESLKETFIPPEFYMNPAQVTNLSASGITDQTAEDPDDLLEDKDVPSRHSSPPRDDESRRVSSTNKMSDFSHTDKETDKLMDCDDPLQDKDNTSLSAMDGGSLSWDSRSSHTWNHRPPSCGSSSSINSDITWDTEEDTRTSMDINAPQLKQEVQDETENNNQAPNFEPSSPAALQGDEIPSSQSQSQDRSEVILQVEVRSFTQRSSKVNTHESSFWKETEAEEEKQTSLKTEPSVSSTASSETRNDPESVSDDSKRDETPAGSKGKKKSWGRFFRWWRRKRVQPAPQKPTAEEYCQADSEGPGKPEVSSETKAKKSQRFVRVFSKMLPKKELKREEEEKKREETSAERHIQQPPFWVQLVCGSQARCLNLKGPNQD